MLIICGEVFLTNKEAATYLGVELDVIKKAKYRQKTLPIGVLINRRNEIGPPRRYIPLSAVKAFEARLKRREEDRLRNKGLSQ